jgi:hypothetical protein
MPEPYDELFAVRYDGIHIEQATDKKWEDGTHAWRLTGVRQGTLQR